jgi:REP element-mobilizing transposase RayT
MARVARRDAPGAVHHVLLRGIERRRIFRDDPDRRDFLSRLGLQVREGGGACLAWVLMQNHVHMVLRTGDRPLSQVMLRLNTGYARQFNLRHRRSGYLWRWSPRAGSRTQLKRLPCGPSNGRRRAATPPENLARFRYYSGVRSSFWDPPGASASRLRCVAR